MEMTAANLEAVKDADKQVQGVLAKLTPAATLKMIRDGFNPLEKSFGELEQYFKTLPAEYKKEAESYSRFLYGLEQNKEITPEERESYIGIYRLVRQIEKADGAVVGRLIGRAGKLSGGAALRQSAVCRTEQQAEISGCESVREHGAEGKAGAQGGEYFLADIQSLRPDGSQFPGRGRNGERGGGRCRRGGRKDRGLRGPNGGYPRR